MKNFAKLTLAFVASLLIGVTVAQYFKIGKLNSNLDQLSSDFEQYKSLTDEYIKEGYVLHMMASRHIRTLFNLRLMDTNPEIQEKLKEEGEKAIDY